MDLYFLMKKKYCFLLWILLCWKGAAQPDKVPVLESTQLETTYSEQGVLKWKMQAPKALQYDNEDRSFPEGIYITFLGEKDGQIAWTVRANSVYIHAENNLYELRGDVELKSLQEKRQLNTEELYWDTTKQEMYTEKFIKIKHERGMLTGQGLVAKQDLSEYQISRLQGSIKVESLQ